MALVSLKQESDGPEVYASNKYGYGTEISLTDEQCEALGITSAMKVGQQVSIRAAGVVTRSGESIDNDLDGGGKEVCVSIQLTDISLSTSGPANAAKAAQMLYGESKE